MKTQLISLLTVLLFLLFSFEASAQTQETRDLQYYRSPDQTGLNVFETPKTTDVEYDGFRIRVGGANTLQFQGLSHSNSGAVELMDITSNFNLGTSNIDLDVQLHRGVRMHLRTYLSSRNHTEAWVKGGYLQVDRLDFIEEDFLSGLMDRLTLKVGHMQINYGDTHFRRTDNAQAIHNPFVGNYIMDSFTTEVGGEIYFKDSGFLAMLGVTNGKLNQSVAETNPGTRPSILGKLGYDSQISDDFRFRLTGSLYTTSQSASIQLHTGDRAGSRYYLVMEQPGSTPANQFRSGQFLPDFTVSGFAPGGPIGGKMTAFMINPFFKYQGLEFFGVYESASGRVLTDPERRTYTQYGAELLYRFGSQENLYLGGRYNEVSGEQRNGNDINIDRFNIGGGWFISKNVLAKVEYVRQTYDGFGPNSIFDDGKFDGIMIEAVISF